MIILNLLTKTNLLKRKVVQEDIYESYKEVSKTVGHVLWVCPKAQEAWECLKVVLTQNCVASQSFQDVMQNLLMIEGIGEDQATQVVTIA